MAVRAFAGTAGNDTEYPLQGNPCFVTAWSDTTSATPERGALTQCYTWPTAAGTAQVNCWTPSGAPIKLCGHGLLSCGTVLADAGMPVHTLIMNETTAQFRRSRSASWIGLPPLTTVDCETPPWVAALFAHQPERAANAGRGSDYLILVWTDNFPLHQLPVPKALGQHTQRALIVTCLDTTQSEFDIRLRYFAPQYGSDEDVATGSAMRVLAHYWQPQLGDALYALQCSPQGGELVSRIETDITWVGGNVARHHVRGAHEEP